MDQDEVTGADVEIRAEYERRQESRSKRSGRWKTIEGRIADARLLAFAGIALVGFLMYRGAEIGSAWLAVPVVILLGLILAHEPVRRASRRAGRAKEFYDKGLERLDGRWPGRGVSGLEFLDESHPYATDLDLFGSGSLFERLCTVRTRSGEETLASWLLEPAAPVRIRERQVAIEELQSRLDLREDLELLGRDVRAGIDPAALIAWGAQPRIFPGKAPRILAGILGTLALSSFIAWFVFDQPVRYFLIASFLVAVFMLIVRRRVGRVLREIDRRSHDLAVLSGLLERIEGEPFQAPILVGLKKQLAETGTAASRQIRCLTRLLQLLDARRNQVFLPLAILLLWTEQIAMAIDAWRSVSGVAIATWLAAVGEFEALCALAAYASENPGDFVPEIVEGPASFSADRLGHPLIPAERCIRNDVNLGVAEPTQALVVTGSNMSGKSTMLRTIGINIVLAMAGARVRATHLRLTPLAIGATLRIQDSLQSGKSRFFAEISRVRQIVEISRGPIPLCFLLDEIFHGTNSADRRIGAEAIVRGLLARGAIGLITTHDLALADIAENLSGRATNVHFEDRFEDGEMHFDYKMKPGIVRHSNALALMRSVGLEV